MAKKGQAVQLQAEINNDEEWEKLIAKQGLILVDIYSDWCGPCIGMSANLKKLKLEIGGDMLQLAVAKSDNITPLQRFRNKSEPTWMFVSNGKMVRLIFGADAPKLTKAIIEELKNETAFQAGQIEREGQEITEMSAEEKEIFDKVEKNAREIKQKELAKAAKELRDCRTKECQNILENLSNFGVVLVFPHCKVRYKEVLSDILAEAGLNISQIEKIRMTEEQLNKILYFNETELNESAIEDLLQEECLCLLLKGDDLFEVLPKVLYGELGDVPGSLESPYQRLLEENTDKTGLWVSKEPFVHATFLKIFFPKLSQNYLLGEPKLEPSLTLTVVFDASLHEKVFGLVEEFSEDVLRFGFFTSHIAEEAVLVAKTLKQFQSLPPEDTLGKKLVLQVVKKNTKCMYALALEGPLYLSPVSKESKRECEIFFPENYDEEVLVEEASSKRASKNEECSQCQDKIFDEIKSLNEAEQEELLYFSEITFPVKSQKELQENQSLALLLKRSADNLLAPIDGIVLQMLYGNMRQHPGEVTSCSYKTIITGETGEEDEEMWGLWAPPNSLTKAAALKVLFPNLSAPFLLQDPPLPPPHIVVAYDAFKSKDLFELFTKFPEYVLAYGYFTNDLPGSAILIAKTKELFEEKTTPNTYEEKIVVKLVKKDDSEGYLRFLDLGPTYMSEDAVLGEQESKLFFPESYNVLEQEIVEVKKKSKKKSKKTSHPAHNEEMTTQSEISDTLQDLDLEDETLIGEDNYDHEEDDRMEELLEGEELLDNDGLFVEDLVSNEADKATSPIDKME